jgi:MFS transporter, ACDE family, multidrug resistance protein
LGWTIQTSSRLPLAIALATSIASTSGAQLVYPVLPAIAVDLHVTAAQIGLAMAALTLPGIVLAPLFGVVADLHGRRWMLILGLVLFGIGGTAVAVAPSYDWLLAFRALQGVGLSALSPLTIVLISDLLPDDRQLHGQGLKVVLDRVAMILLPILGGSLAVLSWRAAFASYAAILPLAAAAFIWMPETCEPGSDTLKPYLRRTLQAIRHPPSASRHPPSAIRQPRLAIVFGTGFLRFFLDYGLYTYLPLLLSFHYGLSAGLTGWLIAVSACGSILTAFFIGRIHRWLAAERLLAIAFFTSAVGLSLVAAAPPLWLIAIAIFLFGLGNGLISPLQKNLLTRRTPIALRGGVISVDRLVQQVAKSVARA